MSSLQKQLFEFITVAFKNKKRKGGEPYINHLVRVAENSKQHVNFGWEIGLCHDLLEDTNVTEEELRWVLIDIGYLSPDASFIVAVVVELTNKFTTEAFPNDNRRIRTDLETYRLALTSPQAQTVKLFDIIDNITDIKNMGGFSRRYLEEKRKQVIFLQSAYYDVKIQARESLRKVERDLL